MTRGAARRAGSQWRVLDDRRAVASPFGVMDEPGRITSRGRRVAQRFERPSVQSYAARRRDRLEHGLAGQLMPKGEQIALHHEHAERQTFVNGTRVDDVERCQEPGLDARSDDGRDLERLLASHRQPSGAGQDRVPHGGGQAGTRAGQHFGDKEGIARRSAMQLQDTHRPLADQQPHRLLAQRGQLDAPHDRQRGEVAQQQPQRVARAQLVIAVRQHQQSRAPLEAASQETQQVEGGLVGPVHVFEDGHGRTTGQFGQHGREQTGALGAAGQGTRQGTAQLLGNIVQRPEQTRGELRVARARNRARAWPHPLQELAHHAGLTHAGFAADQDEPRHPGQRIGQCGLELAQASVTFEEVHFRCAAHLRTIDP